MDDAIKRALEAATQKACNCDCAQLQPGCLAQVADEIAAFHNELAKNGLLFLPFSDGSGDACIDNMDLLAAAVRRVAGGG